MKKRTLIPIYSVIFSMIFSIVSYADVQKDTSTALSAGNKTSATEYVYEDFENWTIDAAGTQFALGSSDTLLSNGSLHGNLPISYKQYAPAPIYIGHMGASDDAFFGFKGTDSSSRVVFGQNYNAGAAQFCGDAPWLKANGVDWVNFDGSILVSYDYLTPTINSAITSGGLNYMKVRHYISTANANEGYDIECMPQISVEDGKVYAIGKRTPDNQETYVSGAGYGTEVKMLLSGVVPGDWVHLQLCIERDDITGLVKITGLVNSKIITDGSNYAIKTVDFSQKTTASYEKTYPSGTDEYLGIGLECHYYSPNNEVWQGIDNIALRVYGDTMVKGMMTIQEAAEGIEFYNSSIVSDATTYVEKAYLDLSEAYITAEKYSANDIFMIDGTEVSGITISKNKGQRSVQYPENATQGVSQCGDILNLNGLPSLMSNEKLVITINDAKDIFGNDFTNKKIVLYDENCVDVGFKSVEFKDSFGKDIEASIVDEQIILPAELVKMTFETEDENGIMELCDSLDNVIAGVNVNNGIYELSVPYMLAADTSYKVKRNNNTSFEFKTEAATVKWDNNTASSTFGIKYANSFDLDMPYKMVGVRYSNLGEITGIGSEDIVLLKNTYDSINASQPVGGLEAIEIFMWNKNKLQNAHNNSVKIMTETHATEDKIILSGQFVGSTETDAVDILAEDGNAEVFYAKSIFLNENGSYTVDIDVYGQDTDEYTFYVRFNEEIYKVKKAYSTGGDNAEAIDKLNKATENEIEGVIDDNLIELEFDYQYAAMTNKTNVAKRLYNYISELKVNGYDGLDINNKQEAISIYRQCVIMELFASNKVLNINDLAVDISILKTSPLKEWYNYRETVDHNRTDNWRVKITNRLNGTAIASLDDFNNKITAALLFSVIEDCGTVDALMVCLSDFAAKISLDSNLINSTVVSKVANSNYTGFDYTALKADMIKYREQAKQPIGSGTGSGSGGNFGGGGSGGKIYIDSSIVADTITKPIETPIDNPKSVFVDMGNSRWAEEAVNALYNAGVVNGYKEGYFGPELDVTREEFVKMIVKAIGENGSSVDMKISDVDNKFWAYEYISTAYSIGIVNGISDSEFGVGEKITRESMATIIYNALVYKNVELADGDLNFLDSESISNYAVVPVRKLIGIGIINGYTDGNFKPSGTATRAEAAKMIYEALKYLK